MQFGTTLNAICKESAMKATTALAKFLKMPLSLNMQSVEVRQIDEIKIDKDSTNNTVNIYMPITGNLPGACFFSYSQPSALALCDILFNREKGATLTFDEPEESALNEVSNIVIGNFLTLFAKSLQLDFLMHRSAEFDWALFENTFNQTMSTLTNIEGTPQLKIAFEFQYFNIIGHVLILFEEAKINNLLKAMTFISDT